MPLALIYAVVSWLQRNGGEGPLTELGQVLKKQKIAYKGKLKTLLSIRTPYVPPPLSSLNLPCSMCWTPTATCSGSLACHFRRHHLPCRPHQARPRPHLR